jgi:addiction module RelE/StbE family toxin
MKIILSKNFLKKYNRLRVNEKQKFKKRRNIFRKDQFNPILNNHSLHGEYSGYRSINITGDLRVLYEQLNKDTVQFVIMDTHSNLYS